MRGVDLPNPAPRYTQSDEEVRNERILKGFGRALGRGEDLYLVNGEKLVLQSPNGTRYYLAVADDGTLSTTAV